MIKSILIFAVSALVLASSAKAVAQNEPTAHAAHQDHAAPTLAAGQRWTTDAPLREAMTRIREGVVLRVPAYHQGELSAPQAQQLAESVESNVQFMIANCKLEPEPDAALHALIGRLLVAASAIRREPGAVDGLPKLLAILHDYGTTFDHEGWSALPSG
jgi:hypothetical protein